MSKRNRGGISCMTCHHGKGKAKGAAAKWLRLVLEEYASGEGECSATIIYDALVKHYRYNLSAAALYNHLTRCERSLWEKAKRGGK